MLWVDGVSLCVCVCVRVRGGGFALKGFLMGFFFIALGCFLLLGFFFSYSFYWRALMSFNPDKSPLLDFSDSWPLLPELKIRVSV